LISLRGQRGHAVVLTFFYTHCPDTCPLTSQKLRAILNSFGSEARKVTVLIVSTDPLHDNPSDAKAFLRRNGLTSWHFLLGSIGQLSKVWKPYGIGVTLSGKGPGHTAGMYLIDKTGREQVYLDDTIVAPALSQDLHILLDDHHWLYSYPTGPVVGDLAPSFKLTSAKAGAVDLNSFRGKPLLVNFWATYCGPCLQEMPLLERTYRKYKGRLNIVGIDEQEPANEVQAYLHRVHVTYPIGLDSNGNTMYTYQIQGTPTTLFLNRAGVVHSVAIGPLTTAQVTKQVKSLLAS
jgi:cytochrome oxidase Cu insertion factor (SCO1/SenC/PrrC family)